MDKVFIKSLDGDFSLQLGCGSTILGRSEAARECVRKKMYVARIHMRFIVENGEVYAEDMGALNGTYVNGVRIPQGDRVLVKDADVIGLGGSHVSQERAAFFEVIMEG